MLGNLKPFALASHDLENSMSVSRTLRSRVSTRAFTSEAPSIDTVYEILDAARWSPSGGNMQPWKVIAVAGRARDEVCELAHRTLATNPAGEEGGLSRAARRNAPASP